MHRIAADRAGGADHQQPRAGGDSERLDRRECSQPGRRKRRGLGVTELVRYPGHRLGIVVDRHRRVIGIGPVRARDPKDPLPGRKSGDAAPHPLDHAGEILPEHKRKGSRLDPADGVPDLPVHRVHAGGADPHEDLVRSGDGRRHAAERAGLPVPVDSECSHFPRATVCLEGHGPLDADQERTGMTRPSVL